MKRNVHLAPLRATLALGLILAASAVCAQTTFIINTLGDDPDSDPGDGICSTGDLVYDPPPWVEECTLRAALEEANATSGSVTIEISSGIERTVGDLSVIQIATALPYISNQVTIAGDSHPDHSDVNRTHLLLKGPDTGSFSGLRFSSGASGSVVRSIGISKFTNSGILISGGDNYVIESNVLGGVWAGTSWNAQGNGGHGLDISNSSGSQITNNVIYNSGGNGVRIRNGSGNNVLQGNVIGLRRPDITLDPFAPVSGNSGHGVHIATSAGAGNGIGFFEGNTISNNGGSGVLIEADGQVVLGNSIGIPHDDEIDTDYAPQDYGNGAHGIEVTSSNNFIGSGGSGRNVIGHSSLSGIVIGNGDAAAADGNEISWNRIGTNAQGDNLGMQIGMQVLSGADNLVTNNDISHNTRGFASHSDGVVFFRGNTVTHNTGTGVFLAGPGQVGSLDPDDANIIGHNDVGVMVDPYASANPTALVSIRNNFIGTDASGTLMGNDYGIWVSTESNRVWIGQSDNTGNTIVNSSSAGIIFMGARETLVAGNLIGVHPDGTPMGNSVAVYLFSGSIGNWIGYAADETIDTGTWSPGLGAGNVIAHNDVGIRIKDTDDGSFNNTFRGNSVHNNGTASMRGIDLGMNELDVGGGTTGPNTLMNYPDFDAAATQYNAATGEIDYRVRVQTTPANADYPLLIDFYLTDGNSPQGKTFIGSINYPATASFEFRTGTIALPQSIPTGSWLVATATDASGNTSQFTNDPILLELPDSIFSNRFETP
jgi:CSLREA domain-containing protein